IGVPGCPEFACCTASIASVRIVFTQRVSSEVSVMSVPSCARPVGDERCDERRPARLMRGAESFPRLAVEVFMEQQLVPPGGILLEERARSPDRTATRGVAMEEAQKTAYEIVGHGAEMSEPSGAGRELDRERVAEAGVQAAERADHEVVEGEPDRPPPVGIAAELPPRRLGGLVIEHELASARRLDEDERVVAVVSRERAQPVGR